MINYTVAFNQCRNGLEYVCSTANKVYKFFSVNTLSTDQVEEKLKETIKLERFYS